MPLILISCLESYRNVDQLWRNALNFVRYRHVCIAVPKVTASCKKLSSHAKMSTNMIIIRVADKVRPPPPAPLPVPGATKGRIQRTCHTKPLMILSRLFYFMYTSQRTAAIRVDLYWDKDCPMLLLFFTIKIPYPPPAYGAQG